MNKICFALVLSISLLNFCSSITYAQAAPAAETKKETVPAPEKTIKNMKSKKLPKVPDDPTKAYEMASTEFQKGNFDKAIDLYLATMKKFPRHLKMEDLQWQLAEANFAKKDFKQALAEYSRFYQDFGTSPRAPESLFQIAKCYEALMDYQTAILSLKVVAKKFSSSPFAAKALELKSILESKPAPTAESKKTPESPTTNQTQPNNDGFLKEKAKRLSEVESRLQHMDLAEKRARLAKQNPPNREQDRISFQQKKACIGVATDMDALRKCSGY